MHFAELFCGFCLDFFWKLHVELACFLMFISIKNLSAM